MKKYDKPTKYMTVANEIIMEIMITNNKAVIRLLINSLLN